MFLRAGTGAHRHRRLHARVAEGNLPITGRDKNLAGDGQRGERAEGMSRHAEAREVEPVLQRGIFLVQLFQPVNREAHVGRAVGGVVEIGGGLAQTGFQLSRRLVLPDGGVAAEMLQVDRNVAVRGPIAAEIFVAFARPAETVGENDHGQRTAAGGGVINFHRHRAVAFGVKPVGAEDFNGVGGGERARRGRDDQPGQREQAKQFHG